MDIIQVQTLRRGPDCPKVSTITQSHIMTPLLAATRPLTIPQLMKFLLNFLQQALCNENLPPHHWIFAPHYGQFILLPNSLCRLYDGYVLLDDLGLRKEVNMSQHWEAQHTRRRCPEMKAILIFWSLLAE